MRQLWVMTLADLRQRLRDGTVVIFGVVVPLALMFVMNLTMGGMDDLELDSVSVAASVPADDDLGQALVGALRDNGVVEADVTDVPADEIRSLARGGEADLGVTVPEGFAESVRRGQAVDVDVVEGDGAGLETSILLAVLDAVLDRFAAGTVAAQAGAAMGVDGAELGQLAQQVAADSPEVRLAQGEAADEQLSQSGSLVAGQAGLFLLFTVGFGVLALVVEREQGTLARLRSMPMRPGLIVAAKGLAAYILGVGATAVLLVAGSLLFDVSFGSPVAAAVVVLCAVVAATSLMFVIARVARTAEQANIAQSILAIVLGAAGGAFFPISAQGTLGTLLDLNPVAAMIRGLGITSGGGGITDLGAPVAVMLGFAIVCLLASRLLPDRGAEL